ncbi:MAG: hypothetical protein B7Z47_03715, partial [Chthoniobacter sp. 12-60-6]
LQPAESTIKELPLLESSDEVVQALALLDQYWKTESWKERVPLVAHSDRVAALMKDFYETQRGKDPVPGGLISKARYQINGTEILYFSYTSNRPTGSLEIAMLRAPEGKFLIDWESLTGYGEMSFQDLRTERPTKPVLMRAYVRLFEYYNFEFSDSKKYLCIKLMSENGESSLLSARCAVKPVREIGQSHRPALAQSALKRIDRRIPPVSCSSKAGNLIRRRDRSLPRGSQ